MRRAKAATAPVGADLHIFLSWSGPRSKRLAEALYAWLPMVLHYAKPWLSGADIDAGERWSPEMADALGRTNFGITCLTPENLHADWILFEAGALTKTVDQARLIPLLLDLEISDVSPPLSQFQALKANEDGIKEMVRAINRNYTTPREGTVLEGILQGLWPRIEEQIATIPAAPNKPLPKRPQEEVLEELVSSVRRLEAHLYEQALQAPHLVHVGRTSRANTVSLRHAIFRYHAEKISRERLLELLLTAVGRHGPDVDGAIGRAVGASRSSNWEEFEACLSLLWQKLHPTEGPAD